LLRANTHPEDGIKGNEKMFSQKNKIYLISCLVLISSNAWARDWSERVMAQGMWHKVSNGDPIVDNKIRESAYIVLDDDRNGKASFQLALIRGDDVMKTLSAFQITTGITSGKGQAVFNVNTIELDQWIQPTPTNPTNFSANTIEKSREGLMVCLFSGTKRGTGDHTDPHCHAMLAGFDVPVPNQKGGFPAIGGHLGGATVNVVLEMEVDSYPEVLEKESGHADLGGWMLTISEKQAEMAKNLLARNPASKR
jgi:predicted DNA-binding protein with PD1-like motif